MTINYSSQLPTVGVGLRQKHYDDALASTESVDFVEVHSENFFAEGGITQDLLQATRSKYAVSLHSTSLGLGSAEPIPNEFVNKLKRLIDRVDPILVSDHASYAWGHWMDKTVHMGDLLPLPLERHSLRVLAENVDRVQQQLGRRLLVENLSSYIQFEQDEMSEAEFLTRLTDITGCGLLIDLNNILVSAHNLKADNKLAFAKQWIESIPDDSVGELHLAGYTPMPEGVIIVDDHSKPISEECWQLYELAIKRFGQVPTLVEWDNELPDWNTLVSQANKAKQIAYKYVQVKDEMVV